MKTISESTKVTLTLDQLKRLVKESAFMEDDKTSGPDFTIMSDDELTKIVKDWWKGASEDDRRWAIYYSINGIDEYSHVWFVGKELGLPGFDPNHYDSKQADFCEHVCDLLKDMTAPLLTKSL